MFSRISKLFMVCIILIAICLVHQAEASTWTQKSDMPKPWVLMGYAVMDGKIYVVGGDVPGDGIVFTKRVAEYEPTTDTWTNKPDMSIERQGPAAAAVDGIIYAFGGWRGGAYLSTVEAYDPATDKWTAKASMPTPRDDMTASVVDGKIYVIGGMVSSAVEVYDPATNKWTRKDNRPTVRWFDAACVINGKIYITGGTSGYPVVDTFSTMEIYDPATDTWTEASDMPRPRYGHKACVIDGKMYLIGGIDNAVFELFNAGKLNEDEAGNLFLIVDVYDPDADKWTTVTDIPITMQYHAAAAVDGKIYVMGGMTGPHSTYVSDVYEFDPALSYSVSNISPDRKISTYWGQIKSNK